MGRYEAVLFDFDGVLVDSEPVHFECWQEILKPFGLSLDWSTYSEHWIGVSDRSMLASVCNQCNPPVDPEQLWSAYARKREMFRERMMLRPAITPETRELIAKLQTRYKLAVVTSSGQTEVEPILASNGVLGNFDTVVYGGDVQRLKPHPDPYLLACERLGTSKALVVEDSLPGLQAARAAELDVIHIHCQAEMPGLVSRQLDLHGS